MPILVMTDAEKAIEQTFVDAAKAHGLIVGETPVPTKILEMRADELTRAKVSPDKVQQIVQHYADQKWVKSAGDDELGAYEDEYQLARAYCRKYSLMSYPEHLAEDAQWHKDQVETMGLDLAAEAEKNASPQA